MRSRYMAIGRMTAVWTALCYVPICALFNTPATALATEVVGVEAALGDMGVEDATLQLSFKANHGGMMNYLSWHPKWGDSGISYHID